MTAPAVHILYVEDDEFLAFVTRDNLERLGYRISHFTDGAQALESFQKNPYDLCLLDVMLPGMDGYSLAERIRQISQHIPILFLTARSMKEDKLSGFSSGADDYITKPFSIEELVMRIEVFLKRSMIVRTENSGDGREIGRYRFDDEKKLLEGPEGKRQLTRREADLLKYLHEHANRRLKREDILRAVWDTDDYFSGRSLDVFISRIRKYLADDPAIRIENIHGQGFCFHLPPSGIPR
jgi:DNA-binding response OmpR family regulator